MEVCKCASVLHQAFTLFAWCVGVILKLAQLSPCYPNCFFQTNKYFKYFRILHLKTAFNNRKKKYVCKVGKGFVVV